MICVEFTPGLHRKVPPEALERSSVAGPVTASKGTLDALVDRTADGDTTPVAPPPPSYYSGRPEAADDHVARAVAGDRRAIDRLLGTIRPLVVRYCRARVGTFASADDVAQDVCLAVLTALPSYRDQGRPFLAFVYGIAAHKVADSFRSFSRNRAEAVPELPESMDTAAGPEQQAMQGELSAQMKKLLQVLPDKQREIVVLRVMVGLSAEETAEAVGSTAGAVRVAQHRALTRLRKEINNANG
ncbi:RNA polymerase sigma-70 factor, ECF subfamily [Lentzea fradiae]|uniref:RNA polymerase sigma-70 factor, ECF subfamily n=1 Tax=Lentzea fradiae TaxID=200378 RepID=A0A1G7T9C5_9PSEU|nr:RNA polymerase sigma-70 factor, ECF subfamily [Lentzea fradiae]